MKRFFILCLMVISAYSYAQIEDRNLIEVSVTSVFDGDGCNVVFPGRTKVDKIRFVGIDAPERLGYSYKAQPYGNIAGDSLRWLINHKQILLDTSVMKGKSRDEYGRLICSAYLLDTTNIQFVLVSKGLAWAIKAPNLKEPRLNAVLQQEMIEAKKAQKGLWASYLLPSGKPARIFKPATWRKKYSIR